jgi:DNA-binding protein HU-beta
MSEVFTRKHLVELVAKKHELSKSKSEAILLDVLADLGKALKKGQKVTLSPFGTFEVKKRAARKGRNPKTGAPVKIKAKKVVRFKAYAGLKNTVG